MAADAINLFQKIRTTEQQRFSQRCLRADAEVRARWAGKGFGTATLHEITSLLDGIIAERAESLCKELGRIISLFPSPPTTEEKAQLVRDYLADIDNFQHHAEAVLEEVKNRHHPSMMNNRHSTRSAYPVVRQKFLNEIEFMFLQKQNSSAPTPATPALPRGIQAQVGPVHFEDFSGQQFERLCFAFLLRYPEFVSREWTGQSGGDDGRDIVTKDENENVFIYQCANYAALTFDKIQNDIAKVAAKPPGRLYGFRVITGGRVSANLREKIAAEVLDKLKLDNTEIWSGEEFEEHLRNRAPDLLRRFVLGEPFPEQPDALKALTTSDTNPPDEEIVTALVRSFDRGVFRTPFRHESSLPKFKIGLSDTINTLNTGRLPSGAVIPSRHAVRDTKAQKVLDQLVGGVVALRATFDDLLKKKEIIPCGCKDPDCPTFTLSENAIQLMDQKRQAILDVARQLSSAAPEKFYQV
jgi:hypothetical protein